MISGLARGVARSCYEAAIAALNTKGHGEPNQAPSVLVSIRLLLGALTAAAAILEQVVQRPAPTADQCSNSRALATTGDRAYAGTYCRWSGNCQNEISGGVPAPAIELPVAIAVTVVLPSNVPVSHARGVVRLRVTVAVIRLRVSVPVVGW